MIRTMRNGRGPRVIGLLDIGSYKIACIIVAEMADPAEVGLAKAYRVVGVGHQRSQGVKAGVVTDFDQAEAAVRAAIAQAERQAGVSLQEVVVSLSCGRMKSLNFAANAEIGGRIVTDEDVHRVVEGGRAYAERDGRMIVHLSRLGFRLDGVSGMMDPRGMAARRLTADLHAVTADEGPIRNLLMVVERCYLNVTGLIPSALASAMAATTQTERRLGVTVVDLGGGVTTLAIFSEGRFIFTDTLPIGSSHLTYDVARTLQTPLAEAERIKALYGTLVGAQSDEHESISYPVAGPDEGEMGQTTKARLSAILRARFESLVTAIGERLERGGVAGHVGEQIVLTGGGSQLAGAAEYAAKALGRPVRAARHDGLSGLPPAMGGPAFSTVVGLLGAAVASGDEMARLRNKEQLVQGYLGRVGDWLKQGF